MTHGASAAISSAIIAAKSGILVLGGLITYFSFKAHRRTGSKALRALWIGFAFVTVGALIAGVLDQFFHLELQLSILIDSLLSLIGFAVITYSLYTE